MCDVVDTAADFAVANGVQSSEAPLVPTRKVVFVSSTFDDLADHRDAVIAALQDTLLPNAMEFKGARSGTPLSNCLHWVRDSDVYLGIVGMRYGSIHTPTGRSFIELEYDEAVRLQLPRLVYLIDEDRHPIAPRLMDRDDKAVRLDAFKSRLRQDNIVATFTSIENLTYQVVRDLLHLIDEREWWSARKADVTPRRTEDPHTFLSIQLDGWDSRSGVFRVTHDELTDDDRVDMAISLIARRFEAGDFTPLNGVVSLSPAVWSGLQTALAVKGVNEDALRDAINESVEPAYLRQLIHLAGFMRSLKCVEPTCVRVLRDGAAYDRQLKELRFPMRSFLEMARESLGRMPSAATAVLEDFVERARRKRNWRAKDTFVRALREVQRRSSQKAAPG
jgi:hypothetical protein